MYRVRAQTLPRLDSKMGNPFAIRRAVTALRDERAARVGKYTLSYIMDMQTFSICGSPSRTCNAPYHRRIYTHMYSIEIFSIATRPHTHNSHQNIYGTLCCRCATAPHARNEESVRKWGMKRDGGGVRRGAESERGQRETTLSDTVLWANLIICRQSSRRMRECGVRGPGARKSLSTGYSIMHWSASVSAMSGNNGVTSPVAQHLRIFYRWITQPEFRSWGYADGQLSCFFFGLWSWKSLD